jgi:hypothetical protein
MLDRDPGGSAMRRIKPSQVYRIASQTSSAAATQSKTTKNLITSCTASVFCGPPQLVQRLNVCAALIGVPHLAQKFIAIQIPCALPNLMPPMGSVSNITSASRRHGYEGV